MDEQLKLAHKVVDVMDRAKRRTCMTLLRYSVDKPESYCAQVWIFATKKEDEKLQKIVYVNYKIEPFFYLLEVMKSVFGKVKTSQPICNLL